MTAYHGGKQRIGLEIAENIHLLSIILEDHSNFKIKGYCEPFCGMLGVYKHIPELFDDHKPKLKYVAGEINESVVKMWDASKNGWKPPSTTTEEEYDRLKNSKSSYLKGFIGHAYGFGGIYFGSYRNKYLNFSTNNQSSNQVIDIGKILDDNNINVTNGDYRQFSKLKGYIIYCDPPYSCYNRYYDDKNTRLKFDHDVFWNWCRDMSKYNIVFVSEYKAPNDFKLVYSKNSIVNYAGKKKKNIESLYVIHSI